MSSLLSGAATAIGLGALTVMHPCPLSTNVAAVSLLFGWKHPRGGRLMAASLFVVAESLTYAALGVMVAFGMLNVPTVANFLQIYMKQLLGPLLVVVGMMVAGILLPAQKTLHLTERFLKSMPSGGMLASLLLGVLIALSFCPMSAAIFFGVLVPLAISHSSVVLYPALFGLGAGIPLLVVIGMISRGSKALHRAHLLSQAAEARLRTVAGSAMILLGVFLSLRHVFGVW